MIPHSALRIPHFQITIRHWHPTPLNKLLGAHYFTANRLKREDFKMLKVYAAQGNIPPAAGKRRVGLHLQLARRQRAADPDAYWKSLLDALVKIRLLKDDNRQWCELTVPTFARGSESQTIITLEDLP